MQISTFAFLTSLLAIVGAAPTTPKEESNPLMKRGEDKCGDSTFVNQSSGGSPTVSDCRQIATNIASGGTWVISDARLVASYGTCAFGVMSKPAYVAVIGNQDIIDLINDSISRFEWEGLVGSKGDMSCSGYFTGSTTISWGIYHT